MKSILCHLSEKLEEANQTEIIKREFNSFVQQSGAGDTSRQLSRFLQHILKESSKLARVLKAINQSIIATPFIRLKHAFPKECPFEDMGGTWKIIVSIVPKEEVVVIHQKTGVSKDAPPIGGYEFKWELVMKFNWELTKMLQAQLQIVGIVFQKGILESNKKKIQETVDCFTNT
jgi:hypothetical protein